VVFDLSLSINTGNYGTWTVSNIEGIMGGSGDDTLTGDGNDNKIAGGDGNDTLIGGAGADVLVGGAGADVLTGGPGVDMFIGGTFSGGPVDDFVQDTVTDQNTGGTESVYP
jgi:Ca2+-binding RTX toxin-like protein